jgi:translocation and assembly module TamA
VDWTVQSLTFLDVDPALIEAGWDLEGYRVGYVGQALMYDGRDRPLDAHRGFYAQLELEEGGAFAGGAFDYARITPELRGYVPLGARIVLAARARVGRLLSEQGSESPITRRYYGGGAAGHRGFGYRRLSPSIVGEDGTIIPTGGDELLESSVEARLDMFELRGQWVSLALFLDGGDVTPAGELSLGNLHWAAGVGLRYDTVIGPIRFDLGYRLNRVGGPDDPDPGSRFAFHLSLGEAF